MSQRATRITSTPCSASSGITSTRSRRNWCLLRVQPAQSPFGQEDRSRRSVSVEYILLDVDNPMPEPSTSHCSLCSMGTGDKKTAATPEPPAPIKRCLGVRSNFRLRCRRELDYSGHPIVRLIFCLFALQIRESAQSRFRRRQSNRIVGFCRAAQQRSSAIPSFNGGRC